MLCLDKVFNSGPSKQLMSSPQDCLSQQSHEETDVGSCYQANLMCRNDVEFISFLDSCVANLLAELQILESSCHKEDMFKNVARFSSLYQTLHKGRLCLSLFHKLAPGAEVLSKSLNTLNNVMETVVAGLNVTNILCI